MPDFIFDFFSEIKACDSSPCFNGGTCFDKAEGKYRCQCKSDYTGDRCEGKSNDFILSTVRHYKKKEGKRVNERKMKSVTKRTVTFQVMWQLFTWRAMDLSVISQSATL